MKRFILLSLIIVLCMVGCGKTQNNPTETTKRQPTTSTIREGREKPPKKDIKKIKKSEWTKEEKNAYALAEYCVIDSFYSRNEALNMMTTNYGENKTVSKDLAEFGLNQMEAYGKVDWYEQALRAGKTYINNGDFKFDRESLYEQLIVGNYFTEDQARYAVNNIFELE